MSDWQAIESAPNGRVVETKIDDAKGLRNEQPLKRQGNLWFFPDGSMYVYYTPTHWREPRLDELEGCDTRDRRRTWLRAYRANLLRQPPAPDALRLDRQQFDFIYARVQEDLKDLVDWRPAIIARVTMEETLVELGRAALAELSDAPIARETSEVSDGYHTFNELYEHRHALFSVVCAAFNGWKAQFHEDGTMFDGWFLAGVETPAGMATYHLPIAWWERFRCTARKLAPKWDGHTANQVPERIASLSYTDAPTRDSLRTWIAGAQFMVTPKEAPDGNAPLHVVTVEGVLKWLDERERA